MNALNGLISECTCIVVDGATNENWLEISKWLLPLTSHIVVVVSSMQFILGDKYSNNRIEMEPWDLPDYLEAIKDNSLFHSVKGALGAAAYPVGYFDEPELSEIGEILKSVEEKRAALVADKFFFAGHSVKWMFAMDLKAVLESIRRSIGRLTSINDFFSGNVWSSRAAAVNSLSFTRQVSLEIDGIIQMISQLQVCTSQYITRILAQRCERKFIVDATRSMDWLGSGFNASVDGWIMELDFLSCVKHRLLGDRMTYVGELECTQDFTSIAEIVTFTSSKLMNRIAGKTDVGNWFLPEIFNQGGFDAVQRASETSLRFLQVTRAADRAIKLQFMIEFLDGFNSHLSVAGEPQIGDIEIVVVVPMEHRNAYTDPAQWKVTGEPRDKRRKKAVLYIISNDNTSNYNVMYSKESLRKIN